MTRGRILSMLSPWLIPLYSVLLIGAAYFKKSLVSRHIGKNPVILSGGATLGEKIIKRGALIFFPLWFGFLNYLNMRGVKGPYAAIGLGLLFGSWVLFVLALIHLKNAWRFGIDHEQTKELITTGIYSKIRNPIYTSMIVAFLGAFLVFPNLIFLILFILGSVGAVSMALSEEKFLQSTFGEKYTTYSKKTGRFLPWYI